MLERIKGALFAQNDWADKVSVQYKFDKDELMQRVADELFKPDLEQIERQQDRLRQNELALEEERREFNYQSRLLAADKQRFEEHAKSEEKRIADEVKRAKEGVVFEVRSEMQDQLLQHIEEAERNRARAESAERVIEILREQLEHERARNAETFKNVNAIAHKLASKIETKTVLVNGSNTTVTGVIACEEDDSEEYEANRRAVQEGAMKEACEKAYRV